jgi:hypothetical protein
VAAERRSRGTKSAAIARQRRCKHYSVGSNKHATVKDGVFSTRSVPKTMGKSTDSRRSEWCLKSILIIRFYRQSVLMHTQISAPLITATKQRHQSKEEKLLSGLWPLSIFRLREYSHILGSGLAEKRTITPTCLRGMSDAASIWGTANCGAYRGTARNSPIRHA